MPLNFTARTKKLLDRIFSDPRDPLGDILEDEVGAAIDAGGGGGGTKALLYLDMISPQTSNNTDKDHVEWDNAVGEANGISVSSGSGQAKGLITLPADKKFVLMGGVGTDDNGGLFSAQARFTWRNNDTSTQIGQRNIHEANHSGGGPAVAHVDTTGAAVEVHLYCINAPGGTAEWNDKKTWAVIQEV